MEILRTLRKRSGLTLREVESATSISNAYLSQLESGKIRKPSAHSLYLLAKLYSVDVETLLIESGLVVETDIVPAVLNPSIEERITMLEKRIESLENRKNGQRFEDIKFAQ